MFWWILVAIAAAIPFLLYGLFRWASADSGIDAENAQARFRVEQEWRAVRRSGSESSPSASSDRLQNVP